MRVPRILLVFLFGLFTPLGHAAWRRRRYCKIRIVDRSRVVNEAGIAGLQ